MDLREEFAKHKMLFIVLGIGIVVLLVLRRRGASSAGSPASALLGYQAQQNQLNAQVGLQQAQIGAQVQAAQAQADAQSQAIQASAAAQNTQTEAALLSSLYDAQQGASVQNNLTAAQLEAAKAQYGSQDYQAGLQADLYSQGISAQEQAQTYQYQQNQHILNEVGAAGLNHGTTSLENSLAGIIAETEGQPGAAQAYANANAIGSQASAYQNASMWNTIGNLGKSAISAVFA